MAQSRLQVAQPLLNIHHFVLTAKFYCVLTWACCVGSCRLVLLRCFVGVVLELNCGVHAHTVWQGCPLDQVGGVVCHFEEARATLAHPLTI